MTLTLNIPADCTPTQFKRELDKAIEGLRRMRKVMFGAGKKPCKTLPANSAASPSTGAQAAAGIQEHTRSRKAIARTNA